MVGFAKFPYGFSSMLYQQHIVSLYFLKEKCLWNHQPVVPLILRNNKNVEPDSTKYDVNKKVNILKCRLHQQMDKLVDWYMICNEISMDLLLCRTCMSVRSKLKKIKWLHTNQPNIFQLKLRLAGIFYVFHTECYIRADCFVSFVTIISVSLFQPCVLR